MPAIVRLAVDPCAGHCFNTRGNDSASPNCYANGIAIHRVTDHWPTHTCPPASHDSNQAVGSPNVFCNGLAVARIGDSQTCGSIDASGSPNVFANG